MGARAAAARSSEAPRSSGSIPFPFIAFPREFNFHKRRLTFGPLARTILELIWEGTQGRLRAPGAPAPEWACFSLRQFAEAELAGRVAKGKEHEREIKALISTAQTAIQDLIARQVISRKTPGEAIKAGFHSPNANSRWYRCNWQDWENLPTPEASPYVRADKPADQDQENAGKVQAIRQESAQKVAVGKPAAWTFSDPQPAPRVEVVSHDRDATIEAGVEQRSGGVIRVDIRKVQIVENKTSRLPMHRYTNSPAESGGTHKPGAEGIAAVQALMREHEAPVTRREAAEVAAILCSSLAGTVDLDWFCTSVRKRIEADQRRGREFNYPALKGMAQDAVEKWPQVKSKIEGKRQMEAAVAGRRQRRLDAEREERRQELRRELELASTDEDRRLAEAALAAFE